MERSRTVSGGRRRTATGMSMAALLLAVIGVLVLASAGFGYRFGWWGVRPAFTILRVSVYAAIVVAAVGVIAAIASLVARHRVAAAGAILAILLAAGTAAVPLAMQRTAESVPPIHDITTDTDNPPTFVALRAVRERAPPARACARAPRRRRLRARAGARPSRRPPPPHAIASPTSA